MHDVTFTICPDCHEPVEPYEPGAIYAVERVETLTIGPKLNVADGLGAWFHPGCLPEAVGYARREPPTTH